LFSEKGFIKSILDKSKLHNVRSKIADIYAKNRQNSFPEFLENTERYRSISIRKLQVEDNSKNSLVEGNFLY